jgi:hypothetical protein
VLALGVAGGVFGIATAVQASIPDANGVIHGCYSKAAPPGTQPGALRVIDTALGQACQISEGALNWNAKGVTGTRGPTGAKGATGPKGPTGPSDISTNYGAATNIAVNTSATVASVSLPVGKYGLTGTADIIGAPLSQAMCSFIPSGGTSSGLKQSANETLFEDQVYETMPIVGEITVTTGPTTVNLNCGAQGGGINAHAALIATRVGTINDQ